MRYSHTTIDFASWPEEPMFSLSNSTHIKTAIHLVESVGVREIDLEISVGDVGE